MRILNLVWLFLVPLWGLAQDTTLRANRLDEQSIEKIEKRLSHLQKQVEQKTLKMLRRYDKEEQRVLNQMAKKDSLLASQFSSANESVSQLSNKLTHPAKLQKLKEYIPGFDSLKTGLNFLDKSESLRNQFPKEWADKLAAAKSSVADLEHSLQSASDIKKQLQKRKAALKSQLEQLGMVKELKRLNKEVYYYQQQLNEYKALLKDPKKLEQRAVAELRKLPAFKDFMKKHSQLAALFALPDNYGTPDYLAGLQTRASLQSQIQSRFAGSNVNPRQYVQQQMQTANAELNKLKKKLKNLSPTLSKGEGGSDMEMPDFKPNSQKTKTFLQRLEYGVNIQTQKSNGWMPVSSDVALTLGYKLNDKSVAGIGAGYKFGWGKDWQHIKFTHEGLSLRSYFDYKLKGSFWMTGGYEQNYQHAFTQFEQLRQFDAWQSSGLIGITKKTKIGKKIQTTQLLWDFLSYQQMPRRQALVFRVGYKF